MKWIFYQVYFYCTSTTQACAQNNEILECARTTHRSPTHIKVVGDYARVPRPQQENWASSFSQFTVPKKKVFLDSPTVCGSKSIGENGARKKKTAFDRPVATERTPPRPRRTASRRDISNRKTAGGGGPRGSRRRHQNGLCRAMRPDDR